MKIGLYARVSTDDKGQDPETQIDIIRDIAIKRGYEIEGEYMDFKSGKDANRPQWKILMEKIEREEIDGIMALRLDRVMRSVKHLCDTISIIKKHHAKLIFSDMEFDPDNPNSQLTINILGAIAEWEREIISTRTREGMQHRIAKGQKFGKAQRELPVHRIALMRMNNMGWKAIAQELGIPKTTIIDRRTDIETEIESIKGSDKVMVVGEGSDKGGSF